MNNARLDPTKKILIKNLILKCEKLFFLVAFQKENKKFVFFQIHYNFGRTDCLFKGNKLY